MNLKNKIIDKIQKLLALATSPVEAEAKSAAAMANKLLIQHNLTMQDVPDKSQKQYEKDTLFEGSEARTEDKFITSLLGEYFFVRIVTRRDRRAGKTIFIILGEETNVAVARYVYEFLHRAFKDLWKQYQKETGAKSGSKQSYYMGLYKGLQEQFKAKHREVVTDRGLILVKDGDLERFVKDNFDRLRSSSQKVNLNDARAKEQGFEKGKSLHISRGIESSSGNLGKYLGSK